MEETIVEVGAEGGSLKLVGRRTADGWEFKSSMVDQSLALFDEGEVLTAESGWMKDLATALAALDRYPWARLHPRVVHPEFRDEVLAAVRSRLHRAPKDRVPMILQAWEDCRPRKGSH